MLNEREFLRVCQMHPLAVYRQARGGSLQNAMRFLREFQESLAAYSKHHSLDAPQHKALAILALLERKIRAAYFDCKRRERQRSGILLPKGKVDLKIRQEWEDFYHGIAY